MAMIDVWGAPYRPPPRVDPNDRCLYTQSGFLAYYGGLDEWNAATAEAWRIDPVDGLAYTKQEFLEEYGGLAEWHAACPASACSVRGVGSERSRPGSTRGCNYRRDSGTSPYCSAAKQYQSEEPHLGDAQLPYAPAAYESRLASDALPALQAVAAGPAEAGCGAANGHDPHRRTVPLPHHEKREYVQTLELKCAGRYVVRYADGQFWPVTLHSFDPSDGLYAARVYDGTVNPDGTRGRWYSKVHPYSVEEPDSPDLPPPAGSGPWLSPPSSVGEGDAAEESSCGAKPSAPEPCAAASGAKAAAEDSSSEAQPSAPEPGAKAAAAEDSGSYAKPGTPGPGAKAAAGVEAPCPVPAKFATAAGGRAWTTGLKLLIRSGKRLTGTVISWPKQVSHGFISSSGHKDIRCHIRETGGQPLQVGTQVQFSVEFDRVRLEPKLYAKHVSVLAAGEAVPLKRCGCRQMTAGQRRPLGPLRRLVCFRHSNFSRIYAACAPKQFEFVHQIEEAIRAAFRIISTVSGSSSFEKFDKMYDAMKELTAVRNGVEHVVNAQRHGADGKELNHAEQSAAVVAKVHCPVTMACIYYTAGKLFDKQKRSRCARIDGREMEFCSMLAWMIRIDSKEILTAIMPFMRALSSYTNTDRECPGVSLEQWKKVSVITELADAKGKLKRYRTLFRGGSFKSDCHTFFQPGTGFRAPTYISSSPRQDKAMYFIKRTVDEVSKRCAAGLEPVLWKLLVDEERLCKHTTYIERSLIYDKEGPTAGSAAEVEFLFAAYSWFEVVSVEKGDGTLTKPTVITLRCAVDNIEAPLDAPTSPWN
eukprot:TRINITY_DN2120_c0_g3_i2.p1 TRINITY_DN2120_c0_g3~~TRINITY_DN2120_c0_g3_i2.p1  ORF type:complete len:813 (+),score=164.17 TRINITY_DN2120_c0_g3_i2:79-2517(+)